MVKELFKFIKSSPTAFHTVESVIKILSANGFSELCEGEEFKMTDGGRYFVKRNGSSLIAFVYKRDARGFMICAAHSDTPALKVKTSGEKCGAYTRLSVERYGGLINYSWLDRPLSIAGRIVVKNGCGIESRLVDIDSDVAVIPSLAIHLNRSVNDSASFNPAVDLLPLLAGKEGGVMEFIAEKAGVATDDILNYDLFLYNREEGKTVGMKGEFILSTRLDDLECVYAATEAFVSSSKSESIPVLAIFDNEEVGSETKQGAASGFLYDTLSRLTDSVDSALYNSFIVSADNAHALHPNHPELSDADNAPILNGGVVIKQNANQKYATDAVSDSIFREICKRAGAKTQTYYNRADLPGGSTLGSIANTRVSALTVDIGLPQLAMHSATETAGASDLSELVKALVEFYSTSINRCGDKIKF